MFKKISLVLLAMAISSAASGNSLENNFFVDTSELTIQQTGSTNYYDQFMYEIQGTCHDINKVWFLSTHSWEPAALGKDQQGRPVGAWLSVQLFKDGSYWADYHENAVIKVEPPYTNYASIFEKNGIQGTWKISGPQIDLNGLGFGMPTTHIFNGKSYPGFKFTLTNKINDARAVNNTMILSRSGTNHGPKGISINQYCGVKP